MLVAVRERKSGIMKRSTLRERASGPRGAQAAM